MADNSINKLFSYMVALIFLTAIYIPFFGSIAIEDTIESQAEKRLLTPLPDKPDSIKSLKRYPQKYNIYYQDNFGFRDRLLWFKELQYWIGDSSSDKVILGKDGWLFFNGETNTDLQNSIRGIRKLTALELQQYAASFEEKNNWLTSRGIYYLFVIAPNKHSIYSEYLPDTLFQLDSTTITDQVVNYLQQHTTVPVLDLRQALLKRKTKNIDLYYKTDTHWNHLGSNIAQYEIAKILATVFPGRITPFLYTKDDFRIKYGPGGDLAVLLGFSQKFEETYPNPILNPCAKREIPKGGNYRSTFTTRCNQSSLSAIIFRDSFFEYLYQYISLYFNQATFISKRMQPAGMEKYIKDKKTDIVIEEWAERFLSLVPERKVTVSEPGK